MKILLKVLTDNIQKKLIKELKRIISFTAYPTNNAKME